ncbi:hypothetical protein BDF19DRAFT_443904 [Syncephalis fuscata]|nr:hypothetical protein BDF19DRAFT_443904 [Syncephalis fuscata]
MTQPSIHTAVPLSRHAWTRHSPITLWTAVSVVAVVAGMTVVLFNSGSSSNSSSKRQKRVKAASNKKHKIKEAPTDTGKLTRLLQLRIQALTIPGIINVGNTCFLAAVIQALAAQSTLLGLLDQQCKTSITLLSNGQQINSFGFTKTLYTFLQDLNQLSKNNQAYSPTPLIKLLERHASWLSGREEQDAYELFQLISQLLQQELNMIQRELQAYSLTNIIPTIEASDETQFKHKSPFCGLLSSQLQCVDCGQTSVLRLYEFDSITLALPNQWTCKLEDCLRTFARPEQIYDYECKRCSLRATLEHLSTVKSTRKTRLAMQMIEQRLSDTLEPSLDDLLVPVKRCYSSCMMKQTAVARGPRLLCLHLPRSTLLYGEAGKNSCAVLFKEILDLSVAYASNGWLPSSLSKASSQCPKTDPTASTSGLFYQLTAVIEHLGSHTSGHFVTYRRVRATDLLASVNAPTSLPTTTTTADRWFRVSDRQVQATTIDRVLSAQAYLLFYEQCH